MMSLLVLFNVGKEQMKNRISILIRITSQLYQAGNLKRFPVFSYKLNVSL